MAEYLSLLNSTNINANDIKGDNLTIDKLTANTASIKNETIINSNINSAIINTATISNLNLDNGIFNTISSNTANLKNITSDLIDVDIVNAPTANITIIDNNDIITSNNIFVTNLNSDNLSSSQANISSLTASSLSSSQANISSLTAPSLTSSLANITSLTSSSLSSSQANITSLTSSSLSSSQANITSLTSSTLTSSSVTSTNNTFTNASISKLTLYDSLVSYGSNYYLPNSTTGTNENKLAVKSDIPSITNMVTTDTTQTISGAKTLTCELNLKRTTDITNLGLLYQNSAGLGRWQLGPYGAESGTNSGSDFIIQSRNDNGTYLTNPVTIKRSTGDVLLDNNLNLSGNILKGTYTFTLPSKTGTLACLSDVPSTSSLVTLNTAQTITAQKTFSNSIYVSPYFKMPNYYSWTGTLNNLANAGYLYVYFIFNGCDGTNSFYSGSGKMTLSFYGFNDPYATHTQDLVFTFGKSTSGKTGIINSIANVGMTTNYPAWAFTANAGLLPQMITFYAHFPSYGPYNLAVSINTLLSRADNLTSFSNEIGNGELY